MRRIYLSHFIANNTPLYGGSNTITIQRDKDITKGDSSNTTHLSFSNHTGTHIDFPLHFNNDGKSLNAYAPEFWFFPHPYILCHNAEENELIHLIDQIDSIPIETDLLLIKTGFQKCRGSEKYWKNNPGLSPALAHELKKHCPFLRAIGMDFISVSSFQNREVGRIAHSKFLLEEDILLIEDMNLSEVNNPIVQIFCFPLLVNLIDGTPITVIAEINE